MTNLMRAARAALVVSVLAVCPPGASAQAQTGRQTQPAAGQPGTLQPMRAQPPANRRPAAQPATPAQRPATQPASARPPAPAPSTRPTASAPSTGRADTGPGAAGPATERWEDITAATANSGTYRIPVGAGHSGPSVLHVQVLLNRAFFSAGMLDGRWGKNTQNAVSWMQMREGLPITGAVDSVTYARLAQLAGAGPTVRRHVLTADDVRGPFVQIPTDIYEHARLRCSCYESLGEKLTETFQTTRPLLARLNPGVKLDSVAAGDTLNVPQVRDTAAAPRGVIRQIIVSGSGNYLQALDSAGVILYHFAATLGSSVDPSPNGDFRVTAVHPNPWWNYQPRLLAHVPDDRPSAMIPPGPNNAVGRVWMSLSAPHYGIHGTKSPETIGYAESAGCVRLTNWDVTFLSTRVAPGTPVAFREIRYRDADSAAAAVPDPRRPARAVAAPDTARRDSAAARPAPAATTPRPATDSAHHPAANQPAANQPGPATTQPATTTPAASQPTTATAQPRPATTQPAASQPRPATTTP
ncbi:L,D-transpeptidase family protein [Longimicrobium sp.]|uniref:L,D-transpeptidase family protein n=1 Tax=Longimicrobium sp. TaxID=2029185 RepID=UPI002E35DB0E|nr:L,D-transpeptidase family protein [Longimicrobium sp.]HEX6036419.1 L,D-transpeptidase family protein [Longimicrobium sp.]